MSLELAQSMLFITKIGIDGQFCSCFSLGLEPYGRNRHGNLHFERRKDLSTVVMAVSYTHLDVYKRQVQYREENGAFQSRAELKKVPKLGPKAFEQCAGFLRVSESKNVLDNTAVHPESYAAARDLLEHCGYSLPDVRAGKLGGLREKVSELGEEAVAQSLGIGVPKMCIRDRWYHSRMYSGRGTICKLFRLHRRYCRM